jgi:hypothetical protein
MPKTKIDLGALEMILGRPPQKFTKGDPRNLKRSLWFQRAARALGELGSNGRHPSRRRVVVDSSADIECGPAQITPGALGRKSVSRRGKRVAGGDR